MTTWYHIGVDLHAQKAAIAWASSDGELEYHCSCSATITTVERTLRRLAKSLGAALTDLRSAGETVPPSRIQHYRDPPNPTLLRQRFGRAHLAPDWVHRR